MAPLRFRFHRLPAASLLEVTVATAILVLVFGLALGSLARLTVTGPRQLELRGRLLLTREAAITARERAFFARTWQQDGLTLTRDVTPYPAIPHLLVLHLTATAGNRPVAQLRQLIYASSDSTAN